MDIEDGTAKPLSAVSVELRFRDHFLVQDKPASSGGQDAGPMASEYLLGAILACQHSTFVKIAIKRRVEAKVIALRGELGFEDGDIVRITVQFTLHAPAATDDQVQTLLRLTDKSCTISQVLKVPVDATFNRT